MKIKLTDDQIDDVVLFEMKRHFSLLKDAILDLSKKKKKLRQFEKEDLERFKEVSEAIEIVIDYYSPPR